MKPTVETWGCDLTLDIENGRNTSILGGVCSSELGSLHSGAFVFRCLCCSLVVLPSFYLAGRTWMTNARLNYILFHLCVVCTRSDLISTIYLMFSCWFSVPIKPQECDLILRWRRMLFMSYVQPPWKRFRTWSAGLKLSLHYTLTHYRHRLCIAHHVSIRVCVLSSSSYVPSLMQAHCIVNSTFPGQPTSGLPPSPTVENPGRVSPTSQTTRTPSWR